MKDTEDKMLSGDSQPPTPKTAARSRRSEAQLPASVAGGLMGMLAGILPATIWFLIFKASFSPTFVFLPLLVYLGLKLLRGYDGRKGLVTLVVFSLAGYYLTLLSLEAAAYVLNYPYQMSILNTPLVTVTLIGKRGVLAGSAVSSAYILPLVFWLLGIFLAAELLLRKKGTDPAPLIR